MDTSFFICNQVAMGLKVKQLAKQPQTLKTLRFPGVFMGQRKGALGRNDLKSCQEIYNRVFYGNS